MFWDCSAGDAIIEFEAFAARQGAHLDNDIAVLAVPARLLLVAAALVDSGTDRLLVRNLRRARVNFNAVAPFELGDSDQEMLIINPAQQRGMAQIVMPPFKRLIFLGELVERG